MRGRVDNTATAAALDPAAATVVSPSSSTSTPVHVEFGIVLEKKAELVDRDSDARADIGEHIIYTFVVTNSGTETLDRVTVDDPKGRRRRAHDHVPAGAARARRLRDLHGSGLGGDSQ